MALSNFLRDFWEEPWSRTSEPSLIFDQHFGSVVPEDFSRPWPSVGGSCSHSQCFQPGYCAPVSRRPLIFRPIQPPQQTGVSEVSNTAQEFRVVMDVHHFRPDELSVKAKDRHVVVSAKHEERPDDHGYIMRAFTRKYVLPTNVDPGKVTSSLSSDGQLTLKAPKMAPEAPKEHSIPIIQESEQKLEQKQGKEQKEQGQVEEKEL